VWSAGRTYHRIGVPGEGMLVLRVLKALCLVVVACLAAPMPAASAAVGSEFRIIILDDLGGPVATQPISFDTTLVTTAGDPIPAAEVTLEIQSYGAATFAPAGSTLTDDYGHAKVSVQLLRTSAYRWTFAGKDGFTATSSQPLVQGVAPQVTARAHDRTLRRGQRLVVRGRTFPVKAGCRITLWRGELRPLMVGPKPVRLARATVRSDGSYRLVHRFHKKARLRVVVKVADCAGNIRGLSPYLRVRVR
jgi:hypothetical protein